MTPDLIKRFTPTPHNATVALSNMVVRVSTNCPLVLDLLRFASHGLNEGIPGEPDVRWRIVVEENVDQPIVDSQVHRFSYDGLAFIRLRHGSFLASERRARSGISFVAADLVEDERSF